MNSKSSSDQQLIAHAIKARQQSYSPYSKFRVGAALLGKSGNVYVGTNIENASYGLTICAERVALFRAVSEGERRFSKIAIVGGNNEPCAPCGACRQVLWEFAPMDCLLATPRGKFQKVSLKSLLPKAFKLK